uniref:2-iminobutanoate/2-iminopropanoate deaminase n=1 Tax=Ciona intestinalis TaxID=7719 RepID=UPI000180D033|nr:2-iminobutanoate/2-iminopropanoate deaminase [Ciona intestinalis]|eukprot:XP_002131010.1 2-iminobutanoate/2-iminopropanoate deaminase [Ciona intestinalis]
MSIVRQVINSLKAPGGLGPYSQAIKVENTLYISGQIGLNVETGLMASDVESQAEQVLKNMGYILEAANMNFSNVVKTTVLLGDINDFEKVNSIYAKYFKQPYPARACFAPGSLPKQAKVEIEAIAVDGLCSD